MNKNTPAASAGKCRSSLLQDCGFLHPCSSRSRPTEEGKNKKSWGIKRKNYPNSCPLMLSFGHLPAWHMDPSQSELLIIPQPTQWGWLEPKHLARRSPTNPPKGCWHSVTARLEALNKTSKHTRTLDVNKTYIGGLSKHSCVKFYTVNMD